RPQHLRRPRHRSGNRNRREHLRPKEQDRDIAGAVVAAVAAAGETARGRHPPLPLQRGKGQGTRYNAGLLDHVTRRIAWGWVVRVPNSTIPSSVFGDLSLA